MARDGTSGQQGRGMNLPARLVARAGVSIRYKLLFAFLGITALMAGLALFGLTALQKANERTEALIHDQERISAYYEIYGYMGDMVANALASAAFDPRKEYDGSNLTQFSAYILRSRLGDVELDLAHMRRRLARDSNEDGERLSRYIADLRALKPSAARILKIRSSGSLEGIERMVLEEFLPTATNIQREAYTVTQQIEARMGQSAKITAQAFLASRQQVIAVALISIGLALLTGFAMSSALIWPVRRIGETLHRVASGGFDARVSVPNRDEMGGLAENVNRMSSQLGALYETVEAQKAELEGLNTALESKVATQVDEIARTNRLRRFLPAQVADLIVESDTEEDMLGTRRGEVTVLFADLRGFTAFSNTVPPAQVIGALNAFHASAGPIVEAHGGTIERFLGDGVMVLFGAPMAMEDAAQRAVDTAIDMMAAVERSLKDFGAGPDGIAMGLGIGIGSGVATLGQIGFEGRQDYSAIGPAPNLASRLCNKAAGGQILISHATAWQVTTELEPAGPFALKGIGPDVAAFQIKRAEGL